MATLEGNADARDIPVVRRRSKARASADRRPAPARRRTPVVPVDADRGRSRSRRSCRRCSARSPTPSRARIRSARPTRRSIRPIRSTFEYQGKRAADPAGPDRRGRPARSPSSKPGRKQSTFIDPANPGGRADHCGSARGGRSSTSWTFAPHWENFAKVWNLIDYPRLLFNTVADRHHRDDRDAPLVHARRVRVRALPVPRAEPPVHAADRDDLPARRRHDHPDLHDLLEARLGRDVAAAARARRSSPTPSTSS